jgi:hypothetical protein
LSPDDGAPPIGGGVGKGGGVGGLKTVGCGCSVGFGFGFWTPGMSNGGGVGLLTPLTAGGSGSPNGFGGGLSSFCINKGNCALTKPIIIVQSNKIEDDAILFIRN